METKHTKESTIGEHDLLIESYYKRLLKLKYELDTQEYTKKGDVEKVVKGSSLMYCILTRMGLIYKYNGLVCWNKDVPVTILLATNIVRETRIYFNKNNEAYKNKLRKKRRQEIVESNYQRLLKLKHELDSKNYTKQEDVLKVVKGISQFFTHLTKLGLVFKHEGVIKWKSNIPITILLASTLTNEMKKQANKKYRKRVERNICKPKNVPLKDGMKDFKDKEVDDIPTELSKSELTPTQRLIVNVGEHFNEASKNTLKLMEDKKESLKQFKEKRMKEKAMEEDVKNDATTEPTFKWSITESGRMNVEQLGKKFSPKDDVDFSKHFEELIGLVKRLSGLIQVNKDNTKNSYRFELSFLWGAFKITKKIN